MNFICNCTNQCPYCGGCCQLNHAYCNPAMKLPDVVITPWQPGVPLPPQGEPVTIPISYG